jgi:hypothetical protein
MVEALAAAECFIKGIKARLGLDITPFKRMTYSTFAFASCSG